MTDITEQDRRAARQWAEDIYEMSKYDDDTSAAARVILSTVDAPAPTLAEELRDMLEARDREDPTSFSGLLARVEQVEQERNSLEQQRDYWCDSERKASKDRDYLADEIDKANTDILHLVSRLVPAPRVITDADGLDRAKRDTIIRDARGVICSRDSMGDAWTTFTSLANQRPHIALPATVLWEPEA